MTFWGHEIKPNKPFTLNSDDFDGTLVLTQATLGISSSNKKSILECTIGDKSPIFVCTLLPDKFECCSLNLEFDEEDEVKLSVIGPTSIHLSGFIHQQPDQDCCGDDDCGEDIAESESESGESDYDSEDDFIDDMNMYSPHSSVPKGGVIIEEIEEDEKASDENGTTKPSKKKKKGQLVVSNNDEKARVDGALESEDEDGFPVSSSQKSEPSLKRKMDVVERMSQETKNKKNKKGKAQESVAIKDDAVAKSKNADNTEASKSENAQSLNTTSDTGVDNEEKKNKKKKKKAKSDNNAADAKTENENVGTEVKKTPTTDAKAKQSKVKPAKARTFANGFVIEEVQMGKPNGKRASRGSKVSVRYIGKLQKNGKQFDSNVGRAPFKFRLGVGQVIKGWDVGVEGMRVGDKRKLTIPPSMGYGQDGSPPQIPQNAWLVFDVELVDVA